jgi:hypothetical protein
MDDIKTRSLVELEDLYQKKLQHWTDRRVEHLKQAEECERQMTVYDQKLRYIKALVNGPQAAAEAPMPTAPVKRPGKRRRKSPIRDATLLVLRNRPGQRLTAKQIRTAIRQDTHKRCTRQAVNVNLNVLEEAGLVGRARAPKGSGAQFVFWAVQ